MTYFGRNQDWPKCRDCGIELHGWGINGRCFQCNKHAEMTGKKEKPVQWNLWERFPVKPRHKRVGEHQEDWTIR